MRKKGACISYSILFAYFVVLRSFKAIERQPPGQMIKVYDHECEIFQQGVTGVKDLLFSWASQFHFDSTTEYHDSGLDVRSVSSSAEIIGHLCYILLIAKNLARVYDLEH